MQALLGIPNDVTDLIIQKLDLKSQWALRLVSHRFKNLADKYFHPLSDKLKFDKIKNDILYLNEVILNTIAEIKANKFNSLTDFIAFLATTLGIYPLFKEIVVCDKLHNLQSKLRSLKHDLYVLTYEYASDKRIHPLFGGYYKFQEIPFSTHLDHTRICKFTYHPYKNEISHETVAIPHFDGGFILLYKTDYDWNYRRVNYQLSPLGIGMIYSPIFDVHYEDIKTNIARLAP